MTDNTQTDLEAEIEAFGYDARVIRKMELTAKAVLILEYNLMLLRGKEADNTAGGLYRRILRGEAAAQEVRLVFVCSFLGGGYALEAARWAADRCFEIDTAAILYGVARDFLKPFVGERQRPPAIDLAEHMVRKPRGLAA